MRFPKHALGMLAAALLVGSQASPAAADQWNERTVLEFSAPVMVPGATLPPGTYEFTLGESGAARDLVRIRKPDSGEVVATMLAVPIKRMDPNGDTVLKFSPTPEGQAPALKAWFYPGSLYGHEFVYPDAEARQIAERTKTVVLSIDVPGDDLQRGKLRRLDPSGAPSDWVGDQAVMAEWNEFRRGRDARAAVRTSTASGERAEGTAAVVQARSQGTHVRLDELEDQPQKYIGQTISVDGEVEEVFGPRLFSLDEANWGDLDGELLVFMPSNLAALVRNDDRVRVTGTIKAFDRADLAGHWGWNDLDPQLEARLKRRPVLHATRIAGGNDQQVKMIQIESAQQAVGTSGTATGAERQAGNEAEMNGSSGPGATSGTTGADRDRASGTQATTGTTGTDAPSARPTGTSGSGAPLNGIAQLANGNADLVGRRVELNDVQVARIGTDHGFFLGKGGSTVFVLPAGQEDVRVTEGETVSLHGIVMQVPRGMADRLNASGDTNRDIYVYATSVRR